MRRKSLAVLLFGVGLLGSAVAATYQIPRDGSNVIGEMQVIQAQKGDTLNRIAIRSGVGYNEIAKANPTLSRKKLPVGTNVIVPSAYVLPDVERTGIVINVAAMRLYYFPDESTVVTYPVAVGKRGWSTPQGRTRIIAKKRNPTWTPPKSIIREAAKKGRTLKKVYPAGPNNPLGTRALRLGMPGYLIHGTNKPWSIGQRRSHGCIRMRRDDVETLFDKVAVGTPVRIIKQRFQLATLPTINNGKAWLANDTAVLGEIHVSQLDVQERQIASPHVDRVEEVDSALRDFNAQAVRTYYENSDDSMSYDAGYQNYTDGNEFTTAGLVATDETNNDASGTTNLNTVVD